MMLDWLGDRHGVPACSGAAVALTQAVERAFADGTLVPVECGGTAGTNAISDRVLQQLERGGFTAALPEKRSRAGNVPPDRQRPPGDL